jgi:hypothetical protein
MEQRRDQQGRQAGQQQGQSDSRQQQQDQQDRQGSGQQQGGQSDARQPQQQKDQQGSRQQQQFDTQGRGQQGGAGGADSRFADQIRENMEVIDDSGQHCGTVDHIEGDRIKLNRSDSKDGQHHYVSLSQVAGIEGNKVRLRERGDNDFGMETRS